MSTVNVRLPNGSIESDSVEAWIAALLLSLNDAQRNSVVACLHQIRAIGKATALAKSATPAPPITSGNVVLHAEPAHFGLRR